jgi:hypothetical protein
MKNTIKLAGIAVAILLVFGMAGCPLEEEDNVLSGTITIKTHMFGNYTTLELTAEYTGSEAVAYQWSNDDGALVGQTSAKFTPNAAGSYTVTVTSGEKEPKTSAAVEIVTAPAYIGLFGYWHMLGDKNTYWASGSAQTYDETTYILNDILTIRDYPHTPLTDAQKTAIGADFEYFNFEIDTWTPLSTGGPTGYVSGFELKGKVAIVHGYEISVTGRIREGDPAYLRIFVSTDGQSFRRSSLSLTTPTGLDAQRFISKKGNLPSDATSLTNAGNDDDDDDDEEDDDDI